VARILLVDDDIAEISAVKRVLTRAGHQPVLATNTNDALTAIDQQRPDLVIVGATCEGGQGIALTRKLDEDYVTAGIPVIVLGTAADAAPAAVQVPRPVDPAQLSEAVRGAVGEAAPPAPPAQPAARPAARPAAPAATAPPAGARKAAADALLARASQLREGAPAPRAHTAKFPAPAPRPEPAAPTVDQVGDELEAVLKRAEDAERAQAAERKARERQADRATVEAAQRAEAEQVAIAQAGAAREAEARARGAEQRRAEEERKRADAAFRAAQEKKRADAARKKAEEEARRAEEARQQAQEEAFRAEEADRQRAEEQRRAEEARRVAEGEQRRAREAEQRAQAEERRRAEEAQRAADEKKRAEAARRKADEERRRAADAEERARAGEEARRTEEGARRKAEDAQRTEEEARRKAEDAQRAAEQSASSEKETRRSLEAELAKLRGELERQRTDSEAKLREALDRAAAGGQAAEQAEAAVKTAIASARAEMDAIRRDRELERTRRAEAEAELNQLAEASDRLASERIAMSAMSSEPSEEEAALRRRIHALRARAAVRDVEPDEDAPAPEREPHRAPSPRVADEPPPPAQPPAELRSGTLVDLPAPRLLALAAKAELGGRIDFQGDAARTLYFDGGRVVGATSASPLERVEEVALRLGLLTRDQHRSASASVASLPARRAGVFLLERGYLKPNELTALVRRRTEEVAFGLFADEAARFRWAPEHVPAEERVALDKPPLVLAIEGVRRRWLASRLDAVLGGAGTLLAPAPAPPPLAELGLGPAERKVLQLADGLRTLDEIVASSPLDPLTSQQLLAALVLVGALSVRVLQAGRPATVSSTAIDLARVRDKLDQVRRADYFAILGVSRGCTPHDARDAADRLLAEFDPRRFASYRDEDLTARVEEIRQVLQDARAVLSEDALREAYVEGL
jgi:CheY-like chemotaxis protein